MKRNEVKISQNRLFIETANTLKNSNAKFCAVDQGADSASPLPVAPAQNQILMSHIQNRIEIGTFRRIRIHTLVGFTILFRAAGRFFLCEKPKGKNLELESL